MQARHRLALADRLLSFAADLALAGAGNREMLPISPLLLAVLAALDILRQ